MSADFVVPPPMPEPAGLVHHEGGPYESAWTSSADAYTDDQIAERDAIWAERIVSLQADTRRLEWLLHKISGKALREVGITVTLSEGGLDGCRSAIDAAMKQSPEVGT